jgi:creatinine amidohydrolase
VDWDDPELDFSRYSTSGVVGDPTHASAALGRRLWKAVVERVAGEYIPIAACCQPR